MCRDFGVMSLRNFQEKMGGWMEGQTDKRSDRLEDKSLNRQPWADGGALGHIQVMRGGQRGSPKADAKGEP